jgi:tripartite-type tricarboxylate transporter receptor subunit TctC
LIAPAGTPRAIVNRLQTETLKIAQSPEFRDFLAGQGYEPLAYDAEKFAARIRTELAKWNSVVRSRNIKVEQ